MSRLSSVIFIWLLSLSGAFAVDVGSVAPECIEARLKENNHALSIKKFRGKVVYLDFWATWCPPCKKSMPFLNNLRNELKDKGFEILAISVDENPADAIAYLDQFPVDYVVAFESTGNCPAEYEVMAMPSSYFIDRKGVIRKVHLGFRDIDKNEVRQLILELLDESHEI